MVRSACAAAFAIAVLAFTGSGFAQVHFPELTDRVVDQARILNPAAERRLDDRLAAHEATTGNQVVVVTVPSLQGLSIEQFGLDLGNHWGIGEADRNNGVLLIVAPNQRQVRIEVGLGLEQALSGPVTRSIVDHDILPAFRRGDMTSGIERGVDAILAAIAGTYQARPGGAAPQWSGLQWVVAGVAMLAALAVIVSMLWTAISGARDERDNMINTGHPDGAYVPDDRGHWRRRSPPYRGSWGGGGGGGGFSGGGGSFGGGGSSGSW